MVKRIGLSLLVLLLLPQLFSANGKETNKMAGATYSATTPRIEFDFAFDNGGSGVGFSRINPADIATVINNYRRFKPKVSVSPDLPYHIVWTLYGVDNTSARAPELLIGVTGTLRGQTVCEFQNSNKPVTINTLAGTAGYGNGTVIQCAPDVAVPGNLWMYCVVNSIGNLNTFTMPGYPHAVRGYVDTFSVNMDVVVDTGTFLGQYFPYGAFVAVLSSDQPLTP